MAESRGKGSSSAKVKQTLEDDRTASVKKLHVAIIDPSYVSPYALRSGTGKSRGKGSSIVRGKHTLEDGKTTGVKKSHVAFTDPSDVSSLASRSAMGSTGRRDPSMKHARYNVPYPNGKTVFSFPDLVWGKVKSHPWWPGEIFDPSYASEMALKHRKEGKLLIAYFEDKTFAWNDKTQLKPFFTNFTEMEKQSKLVSFRNAVNVALEEIARRVEVGLTCSCFTDETYAAMKSKTVDNSGLQKGTCSAAVDRTLIQNSFEPDRLLSNVNSLAKYPVGGADRLQLLTLKAQLKAFYHSKGYPVFSVFLDAGELMENDDALTDSTKKSASCSGKGKSRGKGRSADCRTTSARKSPTSSQKRKSIGKERSHDHRNASVNKSDTSSQKGKSIGKGRSPVKRKQTSEDGRTASVKKSYDAIVDPSIVTPPASNSGKSKSRCKRSSSAKGRRASEDDLTASVKSGCTIIDPSNVTPPSSSLGKRKSRDKGSSSTEGKQTLEYGRTARVKKSRGAIIDPSNVSPPASSLGKGKSRPKESLSVKWKETSKDVRTTGVKKSGGAIIDPLNVTTDASSSAKGKLSGKESSSGKRKLTLHDSRIATAEKSGDDIIYPSNLIPSVASSGKGKSRGKGSNLPKVVNGTADARESKRRRGTETVTPPPTSARNGERTSRIASEMTGSPTDDAANTRSETSGIRRGYSTTSDVLAQLFLVATGPRKEYGFLPTLLSFFTAFRNLIVSPDKEHLVSVGSKSGSKRGRQKESRAKSASKQNGTAEDYWAGLIDRNRPEEDSDYSDVIFQDSPERRESKLQRMKKKMKFAGDETLHSYSDVIFQDRPLAVMWNTEYSTREVSEERTVNGAGEKIAKEYTPTSLILSFSESDALPSVADLINIFRRFGTLEEAETEVQEEEKRARVVFSTRSDAETAYRRTANSRFFGPAAVSYRLKNL